MAPERRTDMDKILLVIKNKGSLSIGKCTTPTGRTFTVIKAGGTYGIKEGLRWMKDGVKRLSTIQKFADKCNYGILISEE